MTILRRALAVLLITAIAAPAAAETLREAAAQSAQEAARSQTPDSRPGPDALMWTGAALFVGGMGVGLYAFIHNKNGGFAEFGEANAVNKKLGAAGVASAFAGGTLLFMATRRVRHAAPSIAVTHTGVTVSKRIAW